MIQIKQATENETVLISLLGRITFKETFQHLFTYESDLHAYLEKTFAVNKIKDSMAKMENHYLIAYYKDLPVGYAKLKLRSVNKFIDSKNVAQLQKIYVLQDFLSLSLGHNLHSSLTEEAKKQGMDSIWLSVLESNLKAINFYKKKQFEEHGKHDFTIGRENFKFSYLIKQLDKN